MDTLAKTTFFVHVLLLALILWTKIYRALPWLLGAVAFSFFAAILNSLVCDHFGQNSEMYAIVYFRIAVMCIFLYALAAWTIIHHWNPYICSIGLLMALDDVCDLAGILALGFHCIGVAVAIQTALRWPNLLTLVIYCGLLLLYAKDVAIPTKGEPYERTGN